MLPAACAGARSASRTKRKRMRRSRNRRRSHGASARSGQRSPLCATRCGSPRCRRRSRGRGARPPSSTARGAGSPMREPRRAGGVCLGPVGESARAMLDEALALFPGARIELVSLEGEELQARLEQAAYLVLPELGEERLPRELIDGFANGLPVIAPDDGAAADLIEPGRNGLLFEAGSARRLARRLARAQAFPGQ